MERAPTIDLPGPQRQHLFRSHFFILQFSIEEAYPLLHSRESGRPC